jgi:hypothetical protein
MCQREYPLFEMTQQPYMIEESTYSEIKKSTLLVIKIHVESSKTTFNIFI